MKSGTGKNVSLLLARATPNEHAKTCEKGAFI
jgi:hypothetical protein